MKQDFWSQRWAEGLTGFNQGEVNAYLKKYWPSLGLSAQARVLVPLCGKSCDLLWLRAQGHAVVGVEFVPQAVHEFFAENSIPYEPTSMGFRAMDDGPPLTFIVGDFLTLQAHQVGPFDAVYDRASIVALPAAMQEAFAGTLDALMSAGSRGLLLSFEYPPAERQGPPFSTDEACLRLRLAEHIELQPITRVALAPEEVARFNVSWCFEAVYTLSWS